MKLSSALLLLLAYPASNVGATSIKMDFLPVGDARTDPIISKTCLSDHVHTFYGPQAVHPETNFDTLINMPVERNTGNVEENKSLYWHPTAYSYDRNSNTYTKDKMAHTSAYYIWDNEDGNTNTRAFPNGFQMIAGMNPDDPANFPNAIAECVNPSRCTKSDCYTENDFFPSTRCDELEVSMSFPTCWDGRLDSDDHMSHVHYTSDGELDGSCPGSHPLRLPQIQFFFRIQPYDGGWHTFSDLSSVYHADYMSGWNETFLQEVLDNCQTDSFAANPNSFCEDFLTFRDAPKCTDEDTCDFADPMLMEKVEAFQPPPLDIRGTVSAEETNIVSTLPRGTCSGDLIPLPSGPTNAPVTPTKAPSPAPTPVSVTPMPTPGSSFRLENLQHRGTCMAVKGKGVNGSPVVLKPCDDTSRRQNWVWDETTHLIHSSFRNGRCLYPSNKTKNGSKLVLRKCNPSNIYGKWSQYQDKTLRLDKARRKCVDVKNDRTTLQLWKCNANKDKKWIVRG